MKKNDLNKASKSSKYTRLSFNRETIKWLSNVQLGQVAGGRIFSEATGCSSSEPICSDF